MVQWSGGRQALLAAFMALIGAYRAYRGYIIIYRFRGLGVFRAGGWLADVASLQLCSGQGMKVMTSMPMACCFSNATYD